MPAPPAALPSARPECSADSGPPAQLQLKLQPHHHRRRHHHHRLYHCHHRCSLEAQLARSSCSSSRPLCSSASSVALRSSHATGSAAAPAAAPAATPAAVPVWPSRGSTRPRWSVRGSPPWKHPEEARGSSKKPSVEAGVRGGFPRRRASTPVRGSFPPRRAPGPPAAGSAAGAVAGCVAGCVVGAAARAAAGCLAARARSYPWWACVHLAPRTVVGGRHCLLAGQPVAVAVVVMTGGGGGGHRRWRGKELVLI